MRTIRRVSLQLNGTKWAALVGLARRYAAEKEVHLRAFNVDGYFTRTFWRARRDALLRSDYSSPYGLQGRMWKMALKDAYETVARQWSALAAALRSRVARKGEWSEVQRHYAFWLLQKPQRLAALSADRAPVPDHFVVSSGEQRQVRNYLRRVIRRGRGSRPQIKRAQSLCLDANMYTLFAQDGQQYIKVMGLEAGRRIVIPLTGYTPIRGNLRLVLDEERQRVEIHYTAEVKPVPPLAGEPCGLDAGITEVFTDEEGRRYGTGFGELLSRAADHLKKKGAQRNRLHQVRKRAEARGDRRKARHLRRFNLGRQKLRRGQRRVRTEMARQINTATNQVLRERQPAIIATERLDLRGKSRSKHLSRQVALWARSILKERVEFKASARGSRREQVNPAYSSQTCPVCGFVHPGNRQGDAFQCRYCGHADDADRVAAYNLKARLADDQIQLWTPGPVVKAILLARFNARLESPGDRATVSGWTPGAGPGWMAGQPESETTGAILPGAGENTGARRGQT